MCEKCEAMLLRTSVDYMIYLQCVCRFRLGGGFDHDFEVHSEIFHSHATALQVILGVALGVAGTLIVLKVRRPC